MPGRKKSWWKKFIFITCSLSCTGDRAKTDVNWMPLPCNGKKLIKKKNHKWSQVVKKKKSLYRALLDTKCSMTVPWKENRSPFLVVVNVSPLSFWGLWCSMVRVTSYHPCLSLVQLLHLMWVLLFSCVGYQRISGVWVMIISSVPWEGSGCSFSQRLQVFWFLKQMKKNCFQLFTLPNNEIKILFELWFSFMIISQRIGHFWHKE